MDRLDMLALAPDYIRERIERGQKFNAYECTDGRWIVAVGPVTDAQRVAACETEEEAAFVAAALRSRANLNDKSGEGDNG